jgi:hypothetical protein
MIGMVQLVHYMAYPLFLYQKSRDSKGVVLYTKVIIE